jgi:hypothetical protein
MRTIQSLRTKWNPSFGDILYQFKLNYNHQIDFYRVFNFTVRILFAEV